MTQNKRELTNQELDNACGGDSGLNIFDLDRASKTVKNSKGRTVGEYIDGILYYQPCNICKKPMWLHIIAWECTVENHSSDTLPSIVPWTGTEEELKAASL